MAHKTVNGKTAVVKIAAKTDWASSTCGQYNRQPLTLVGLHDPGPSTSAHTGWQPQPFPSHQLTLPVPKDRKPLSWKNLNYILCVKTNCKLCEILEF